MTAYLFAMPKFNEVRCLNSLDRRHKLTSVPSLLFFSFASIMRQLAYPILLVFLEFSVISYD